MRRGIKKPCGIKVIHYADHLIDFNEYLDSFPGDNLYDKIGVTEMNEILFNCMPNSWSKQSYVQGFYCESILFKIKNLTCLSKWILLNLFTKL